MNSTIVPIAKSKLDRFTTSAAILFSCLAISLPGCVPALRPPLPGTEIPHEFAFNNRPIWWNGEAGEPNTAPVDAKPPAPAAELDHAPDANAPETKPAAPIVIESQDTEESTTDTFRPRASIELTSLTVPEKNDIPPENSSPASEPSLLTNGSTADLTSDDALVQDKESSASAIASQTAPAPLPTKVTTPTETAETDPICEENSAQLPLNLFFDDPHLIGLIYQAFAENQELRILAEEINIANNEVYARSGEYRPFVRLGGAAGLEKPSRFTRDGAVEEELEVAPGRAFPDPLPDFLAGASVSWELDVWKKLRNAQNAAGMRYLASQEGRNYIVTRLVAEIAETYYELLALDNRLLTLQQTIRIQQESLDVAKAKKEAGRGTELAVQRFQAEVRKNESELLVIKQAIIEAENRINFLVGRYPQPVERSSVDYINLNLTSLSSGLPVELLMNRADIRQAEREVAAAGLDIKVARARFYPSFDLRAGIGLQAYNLRYLFTTPESLIYHAALEIAGPLINRRAIKADYYSANAAQLQKIYEYQKTVLVAHIEVVNFLTKVENYRQSIEVKKQQLEALEASVDAANKLFQNARAEYVEVLLAQREMMEARMVLIETKQQQLGAIVNAYQALGGGGFEAASLPWCPQ